VSDRERALELTQDAFMKTWKYIVSGGMVEDYRAFLYRTVNNLIIDEYRKRSSVSLDAILETESGNEGDFNELVTGGKMETEMLLDARQVHDFLAEMPEQYRSAIVMRYMDGLSPKEIAEMTGESENVISVRIHRGMKQLRQIAAKYS